MSEFVFKQLLSEISGEDPTREGLIKTPKRAAAAFDFLVQGYREKVEEILNGALFEKEGSELVVVSNVEFYSLCEHHLLPFYGICHVGYLPKKKVIGLSKIPRIIDLFSRRLQIQERLTSEILSTLVEVTDPEGAAVIIKGEHLCSKMRGVKKQKNAMTTSASWGSLKQKDLWQQFERMTQQ